MKVAIYTRVSTHLQKQDLQISELLAFCQRMQWDDIIQYNETESSKKYRPIFEQLMKDAKKRKFDILLVYKIDRLGRSIVQIVNTIKELDRLGIRFLSITQPIDTDKKSPVGTLTINILASVAEFEREIIVERVNSGLEEYKRAYNSGKVEKGLVSSHSGKNKAIGRPKVVVDKLVVYRMRHEEKMSIDKIANVLKISHGTVYNILKMLG